MNQEAATVGSVAGPLEAILRLVADVANRVGVETYVVGGYVRDVFLGRPTPDLDFVSVGPESGIRLAEAVGRELRTRKVAVYANFGTAAVRLSADQAARYGVEVLEFVAARKESYSSESRKPSVDAGTLEDDQLRRDFTVNALAVRLDGEHFGTLLDPFDGIADLQARVLRTPRDPEVTFEDDPLRMIRAARFAAQLGFELAADVRRAMTARAERIRIVSQERITDELQKIMLSDRPSVGFRILFETGLLQQFFPELADLHGVDTVGRQAHKDNFYHTLQVVDNLVDAVRDRPAEETLWLRWAALLHDIAKPRTKRYLAGTGWTFHGHEDRGARMVPRIFKRLRLPTDDRQKYVQKLVLLHHRPVALVDDAVTDSAVRRLLFDAGPEVDDLMTLVRADITSKNERRVRRYLRAFDSVEEKMREVDEKDRLRNFQPPVDGKEIMDALGLPPSRVIGTLKSEIREAILEGRIPNEHDAAFAFLMEIKDGILDAAKDDDLKERRG